MERPPRRPDDAILSAPFLRDILFYGALITASTLGAFLWALAHAPERATTVAFMTLALAQVAHLGQCPQRRARAEPDEPLCAIRTPCLARVVSVGLQVVAVSVPSLRQILHLAPLTAGDWLVVLAAAAVPAVVGQGIKLVTSPR